jgi:hypothetical protein
MAPFGFIIFSAFHENGRIDRMLLREAELGPIQREERNILPTPNENK